MFELSRWHCKLAVTVMLAASFPAVAAASEDPPQEDSTEAPAELLSPESEPQDPDPVDSDNPDAPNGDELVPEPICPDPPGEETSFIQTTSSVCLDAATASLPGVTWSTPTTDIIKFRNADGIWWIYKRCIDYLSGGFRYNVGPGYIGRVTRAGAVVVNDLRARSDTWNPGYINAVHGGLGTFGWHHARGGVGATPAGDDPTTPGTEQPVGRDPKVMEGRMCSTTNGGNGVYARNWFGPTRVDSNRVDFTMDVWMRDSYGATGYGPGGNAIVRVRYRYSFYRSSVRAWIGITTYAAPNEAGTPFVKEPKLTAVSRGGGFTRIAAFGGASGTDFLLGMMAGEAEGTQVLRTRHTDEDGRKRVRWDFATSTAGSSAPGCTSASPCMNVVMRAYPMSGTTITRGLSAVDWEGSAVGLDQWAVTASTKPAAYPRDTRGDNQVTSCGAALTSADDTDGNGTYDELERSRASERATPAMQSRRRWEHGGWKAGAVTDAYESAFTFFTGWEDERGPEDCEPMQRAFGSPGESFGTFASFSLNDGWSLG